MEIRDFRLGKSYKKVDGATVGTIGECIEVFSDRATLRLKHNESWSVQCNPEHWELIPKEWKPERGERVMVRNGGLLQERIYVATIEGAYRPYVCVSPSSEKDFNYDNKFNTISYRQIAELEPEPEITLTVNGKDVTLSADTLKAIKDAL